MSLAGFKAQNHPQQVGVRGRVAAVDDRAIRDEDFAPLYQRFGFTIDAAASASNAKLPRFWTEADDALAQDWWGERVWCNPPYSDLSPWVQKAWRQWRSCHAPELVVMLVPANRTEQRWWQGNVEGPQRRRDEHFRVEFLPGRMRFYRPGAVIGPKGDRPPFGCCLLIWERSA